MTLYAKSLSKSIGPTRETLWEHSHATYEYSKLIARRAGHLSLSETLSPEDYWRAISTGALLHDAGKSAPGFQKFTANPAYKWGHRHEMFSLGFLSLICDHESKEFLDIASACVVFHHKNIDELTELYGGLVSGEKMGDKACDFKPIFGHEAIGRNFRFDDAKQFIAQAQDQLNYTNALTVDLDDLADRARDMWQAVCSRWSKHMFAPLSFDNTYSGILALGALASADHSASGHVPPDNHWALPQDVFGHLNISTPYAHQSDFEKVRKHGILIAPTGSGKTESGLAWASQQYEQMPGEPRLVWVLPYKASIRAMQARLAEDLIPHPGQDKADIGVIHSSVAQDLLAQACDDDVHTPREQAVRAKASAEAMKVFQQRIRVSTLHQLIFSTIGGAKYAPGLTEQMNSIFVLDELHAYDPSTLGRTLALMKLWVKFKSRFAVVSATLPPPLTDLVKTYTGDDVTLVHADSKHADERHRLTLSDDYIDSPESQELIEGWVKEGNSVLVVCNTVKKAQYMYDTLLPFMTEHFPDDEEALILLHSRFKTMDRNAVESAMMSRYPERKTGEPQYRRAGVVVTTQAAEVSLRIDLDKGITEVAPVESIAQRAGRVNRAGKHPLGTVDFYVCRSSDPDGRPYLHEVLDEGWKAMSSHGDMMSDDIIQQWLKDVYSSSWGEQWAEQTRRAADNFWNRYLTTYQVDPFRPGRDMRMALTEDMDSVNVLMEEDLEEYLRHKMAYKGDIEDAHPLYAHGLCMTLSRGQAHAAGGEWTKSLNVYLIPKGAVEYTPRLGMRIPTPEERREDLKKTEIL